MAVICTANTFSRTESVDVTCTSGISTETNTYNLFYCEYQEPEGTLANAPYDINIQGNFFVDGCDNPTQSDTIYLTIPSGSQSASTEYLASYFDNCGDPDRIGGCPVETIRSYDSFTILADPTPTPTNTPSYTPTNTPTPSYTSTNTPTPSYTSTNTPTPSYTSTNTPTPSYTPTMTPTATMTPTPSNSAILPYNSINECESFTVYPLGVLHNQTNPTTETSNDGSISLIVTGGTSPYSFFWGGGQRTQNISNLIAGSYSVTVTDYYGDFSVTRNITLINPSPTPTSSPTPTPTITPSPVYNNLCLMVYFTNESVEPKEFVFNGYYNSRPTWVQGDYDIVWYNNRWTVSGLTYYGGILVSDTTSNIPDSGWKLVGTNQPATITMKNGVCTTSSLMANVIINNNKCANPTYCNGSIIMNVIGGTPPYAYSINNGLSYQAVPIFNRLCAGTYSVSSLDSSGLTVNKTVKVGFDDIQSNYLVSIDEVSQQTIGVNTSIKNWVVNVTPDLPEGVFVLFNIDVFEDSFIHEPGSGDTIINTNIYKNNTLLTPVKNSTSSKSEYRPYCDSYNINESIKSKTYSLRIGKGDVVSGNTMSYLRITTPQTGPNGCSTKLSQNVTISITSLSGQGCGCCEFTGNNNSVKIDNHYLDLIAVNTQAPSTLYPIQMVVGNDELNICLAESIYGFINSPIFVPGVKLYSNIGDALIGYSYIKYNDTIYNLNNVSAIVGQPTGNIC